MNHTRYRDAYRVTPIAGPGMQWPAAIGFAKKDKSLRDATDDALAGMQRTVSFLLAKYDFPSAAPVELTIEAAAPSAPAAEKHTQLPLGSPARGSLASGSLASDSPAPGAIVTMAAAAQEGGASKAIAGPAAVEAGKQVFNSTCSHCHGPDAIQSDRHIDLRRLKHKYDSDMDEVFTKAVHEGRASKGMPNWTRGLHRGAVRADPGISPCGPDRLTATSAGEVLAYLYPPGGQPIAWRIVCIGR